jgi:deoxyribonuclease IV
MKKPRFITSVKTSPYKRTTEMEEKRIRIGAHTSAAGGLHNALLAGASIGATTVQMFTRNQRTWKDKDLTDIEIQQWRAAMEETGLTDVMSHNSYLINLGSHKEEMLAKSREAFRKEIQRCTALEISYLVFHPGSALESPREQCLDTIAESLMMMKDVCAGNTTRLLLETTAGQGTNVGSSFEEIAYIIDKVKMEIPIGVCIDTCHIFAAGYDIRTEERWEDTLKAFDDTIGIQHLYAFHLNDSMKPFGSRKDRHAPLGEGEIGMECFEVMMHHPLMRDIPKYLETPGGPDLWKKEIQLLKGMYREMNIR